MKVATYNIQGKPAGEVELLDAVFARSWNSDLVHQVLMAQQANRRKNIAHTKTRGEVSGGGKKPWRQKGTGRARHGSIRSPIWVGGGVAHGPRRDRDYTKKINKKMARRAIYAVVSKRLADGELKIIEALTVVEPKTREIFAVLKTFSETAAPNALVITGHQPKIVGRAIRNIPKVKYSAPDTINLEDLLKYKMVLFDKDAAAAMK